MNSFNFDFPFTLRNKVQDWTCSPVLKDISDPITRFCNEMVLPNQLCSLHPFSQPPALDQENTQDVASEELTDLHCLRQLQNDQSRMQTPTAVGSKRPWKEEEEDAAGEQPIKKQATENQAAEQKRGAHVKNNPQMQQHAREGQAHWLGKVSEMRKEWDGLGMWRYKEFQAQIEMCTRAHVKSQHECLLRQLQMALAFGWIKASAFSNSEHESFLGWTGFEVVPEHGQRFRCSIEAMFERTPNGNTLNNTLRRAGLFPTKGWDEAWTGVSNRRGLMSCFQFNGEKRGQYTSKKST